MLFKFTLFLLLIICCKFSFSQSADAYSIYRSNTGASLSSRDSAKYFLVKVKDPHKVDLKAIHVVKRIGYNVFIVRSINSPAIGNQLTSAEPSNSLWKATDNLIAIWQKHPAATREFQIKVVLKPNKSFIQLTKYGTVLSQSGNTVILSTAYKNLPDILNSANVLFANINRKAHAELVINDIDLGANNISAIADNYPGINGTGINVSVKEDAFDPGDLDLLGRSFVSVAPSPTLSQHATTMATLIGGNGNSFIKGIGAAPLVKFTSSSFAVLLPDSTPLLRSNNISIQNHSYGTGIENYYSDESMAYDQQVLADDTLVHVFSSGNVGTTAPATGTYSGLTNFANITGTFKQAKNIIVAGGTDRNNVSTSLSSAGPAYDGRVVPQIVADGEDGTSGSSALVSGTIALLQQAYKQQYGKLPSSALIKSVLINSADKIDLTAVDFKTGYGKLNALEALRTLNDNRFETGTVASGEQKDFTITVPIQTHGFRVSLSWNDAVAQINAPAALVNDLDLSVTTPGGTLVLPWVLSTFPNADSLTKAPVRQRDTLNNTEQVTMTDPPAGNYIVHINGSKVPSGSQTFYITQQFIAANKFEWIYPAGPDHLITADSAYLRWQNSYDTATGQLSVSYDHGANWQLIDNVNLKSNYYTWLPPDVFTMALLKMVISGQAYLSKEFIISKPLNLGVGFTCTTGTLLQWNAQPGTTGYAIYNIKDNQLQKVTTTTDTTVIITPQQQSSNYFAVSAIGDAFEGVKSVTTDISQQGVGCYVRTLFASVNGKTILLDLNLGSLLNLKSVTWQKETGADKYVDLGTTAITGSNLELQFTDPNPKNGIQYYRVKIITNNGTIIYSELASATYLQPSQFAVFPNPVISQVTILSGDINNYELKVYTTRGALAMDADVNGLENTYNVTLPPGVYAYTISLNGKVVYKGKMVKI